MDFGTILGLVIAGVLIAWSMLSGGKVEWFFSSHALAIVFGGAFATVLIGFPIKMVGQLGRIVKVAFFNKEVSAVKVITDMVSYAEVARRDGILSLENMTKDIKDEFIVRGIQMAVDGVDPEVIEQIMTSEMDSMAERHAGNKLMLDAATGYAPALGMVGTLLGLVIMLQSLDDPKAIGPGMAVAIIATLYGAIAANLLIGPVALKLGKRSEEEVLIKTIIIKGVMSIQSGDNPRIVEQKLKSYLSPKLRRSIQSSGEEKA